MALPLPRQRPHPRRDARALSGVAIARAKACLTAAALVAAAGCGAAATPPHATGTGGCDGRELVFVNCSGCHDGVAETTGFLDLGSPESIANLVGQPAAGPKCRAGGTILVNRDGSGLFLDKLRSPAPCGDRMPQGSFPLSEEEVACVTSWVATVAAGR